MKTIISFLALSMTIGLTAVAQNNGPAIEFTSLEIDYGDIERGSNGVRIFTFSNTGNQELIIQKVYSSCGCTIPKKPEEPIAPGEQGEIQVKYDTNRVGPIRKTITVNSNATETPIVSLKIKGTVL